MAKTTAAVSILAATSGAAGSTRAAPGVTGGWVDVRAYYGGELGWGVKNGGSAPTVAGSLLIQTSPDNGTTVFDYHLVGGDTVANSDTTNSISLGKAMYIRVLGYGNATNAVTYSAILQAVTGL